MEEKFRIALEEARKNGEDEELLKRDEEEIQNAISEQQKIYIEFQRILNDTRKIFNTSSEEVRDYSNRINNLLDRLKVINDIIDKNAKAYGVNIGKGELPFNESDLEKPMEQNYFSGPVVQPREQVYISTQPQSTTPEKPEDKQPTQVLEAKTIQSQRTEEQPEPPTMENAEVEAKNHLEKPEIIKNENQMKVTKKDLELAKIANDFYCGKIEGHKFSKEDKLFFANNTLEDIKKKYGENVFPVTIEDEELFDEFIKYQSLQDGLYMTKEDRKLMMKNRDAIFYNKELVDPEAKKLYDRFFKDCNGDEYEIILRYDSLSTMDGKVDDIYKKIEEKFRVKDFNRSEKTEVVDQIHAVPIPETPDLARPEIGRPVPVGPRPIVPAQEGPVGPEPVEPRIENPKPENQLLMHTVPVISTPMNNVPTPQTHTYSTIVNPIQTNTNQQNAILDKALHVDVKVLGKRMLVNGKEYEYKTKYDNNIDGEISEIFFNIHESPILTKFITKEVKDDLLKMSGNLKYKYPNDKILDPNVVYAIVQVCKDMINITGTESEREKSIEIANEYFKKLMYQYMRYASGNFERDLGFNDLTIEYNLKEAMKLDEEDRKVIEDWAKVSKKYAKIVDIGFLQKIINKIKSLLKKKDTLLLENGKSKDKGNSEEQKNAETKQEQIPEKDSSFVQKIPPEQQTQQGPVSISPEPSVPNKNDDRGNLEP